MIVTDKDLGDVSIFLFLKYVKEIPSNPSSRVTKIQYETHVLKIVCFRQLSSLGSLLESILAHAGLIWTPKLEANIV